MHYSYESVDRIGGGIDIRPDTVAVDGGDDLETLGLFEVKAAFPKKRVIANGDHVGGGYGIRAGGMIEALPCWPGKKVFCSAPLSGKGMAGIIHLVRTGFSEEGKSCFPPYRRI